MAPRLELQTILEHFTQYVYFQPPSNIGMQYPCIIYKRNSADTEYADNDPYRTVKQYEVTVIDRDPDSPLWQMVAELPLCRFERHFTAGDLNHDVFNLFF